VPCSAEAAEFCPGETDPFQVLTCLSQVNQGADANQLSEECLATVSVFDQCMASGTAAGQEHHSRQAGGRVLQDALPPIPCFPTDSGGEGTGGDGGEGGGTDDGGSTNKNGGSSGNSGSGSSSGAMQGEIQ
jgi:uncharacterized membrane protein YgcG